MSTPLVFFFPTIFSKGNNFHDFLSNKALCKMVAALNLLKEQIFPLTLLHSERPKLYTILAFLSAIGLKIDPNWEGR